METPYIETAGIPPNKPTIAIELAKSVTRVLWNVMGKQDVRIGHEPESIPPGSIVVFVQVPKSVDLEILTKRLEYLKVVYKLDNLTVKHF